MHNWGGRQRIDALLHEGWLFRPANESLGGNYGVPLNKSAALGYTDVQGGGNCTVVPDAYCCIDNTLSMLSASEWVRRLVMHREDAATRLPDLAWEDVAAILYGAESSVLFPTWSVWGGMSVDVSVWLQDALDMDAVEATSRGQWRIFGKLGYGTSTTRLVSETVYNGYACLPALDAAGQPLPDAGLEFFISAKAASPASLQAADEIMLAQLGLAVRALQGAF